MVVESSDFKGFLKFPSPQHRLKVIQQQHVALFEDSIGTCLVGIGKRCALHRLGIEVVELATSRIQPASSSRNESQPARWQKSRAMK